MDAANEKENDRLVAHTVKEYGSIDFLFANAGILADDVAHKLAYEKWQHVIDVNLNGLFLINRAVIDYWLKTKKKEQLLTVALYVRLWGNINFQHIALQKVGSNC